MNKFSKTENNGQLNTSFSESVSFNNNYNCSYTLDKEQIDKKLEADIADQKERTGDAYVIGSTLHFPVLSFPPNRVGIVKRSR